MAGRKDVFNDVKPGNQLIANLQKKSCFIGATALGVYAAIGKGLAGKFNLVAKAAVNAF